MAKKLSLKTKAILSAAGIIVIASCWLGGSVYNLLHNKWELHRLTQKQAQLDEQYQQLLTEKKLLEEKDPQYMELLARTRYHMVKPGEIEFRFTHD